MMTYKTDLAAPGTCLLAGVFDEAAYPAGDAWIFPRLALDDACILALWMNSTFFLVDLLVNRTEQRGAWMRFDKPVLNQLMILNPSRLLQSQRQQLLGLYARTRLDSLPSLLVQLTQARRLTMDEGILRILGVSRQKAALLATKAVSAALEAISDLAATMRGD